MEDHLCKTYLPPQPKRDHVSSSSIRGRFSQALSNIYQREVPLYGDLISIVSRVNESELKEDAGLYKQLSEKKQIERLSVERHGAIRLGTAAELQIMKRFLRVMDMVPVGYYDLSQAGLPVHATCFRTTDMDSLMLNPFRLFTSLLRIDMIKSKSLRHRVTDLLSQRQIFHKRVIELVHIAEVHGGLMADESSEFIKFGIQTFAWNSHAVVTCEEYESLVQESPLLADITAFPSPHINHLTPRSLNIDAVQAEMLRQGIKAKLAIEGPPKRKIPILLRQTSFRALEETVLFQTPGEKPTIGHHTARFGEVEMRGAALTPKGRRLYDSLIESATEQGISPHATTAYSEHFLAFPDDINVIREQRLAWFQYSVAEDANNDSGLTEADSSLYDSDLEDLIRRKRVVFEPLIYEDFLPFSAAGIFQSNLKKTSDEGLMLVGKSCEANGEEAFERALGGCVLDEMELYRAIEDASIRECLENFRHVD